MEIKVAQPEDAPIIQKYLPDSDNGNYIQKWLDAQSRNENLFLIAWDTDDAGEYRPVGRVTLVMTPPPEEISRFLGNKVARVEALLVDESMRRRGVGRELMFVLESEAEKRGFSTIQLGVEPQSLPAVSLYKRLGYKDWGHGQITNSWTENRNGKRETVTVQTDVLVKKLISKEEWNRMAEEERVLRVKLRPYQRFEHEGGAPEIARLVNEAGLKEDLLKWAKIHKRNEQARKGAGYEVMIIPTTQLLIQAAEIIERENSSE